MIDEGVNILILSDRIFDREKAPIPALLAVSGLHHHLIREGKRTRVGLVLESGEPREVHHFCLLLSYGAQAINPFMVYESLRDMIREGMLTDLTFDEAVKGYNKAAMKGVVKVMSKMGISTFKSYRGAQIFEAVGIKQAVIDKYFTWTDSRVEGVGLDTIALEAQNRHENAYPKIPVNGHTLDVGGQYQWRQDGEHHMFNPQTVHKLQLACRTNNYDVFKDYAELINDQSVKLGTLRGLLDLKYAPEPIPIEEVEPVESICRRFKSGAMSYGSISKEAHETLAIAMNRIGGKSNTGEGGEDPARYTLDPNGDSRNSANQTGCFGSFRGHHHLSGQRQGASDQDGAGGEARRRRRAARAEGLPLDRQGKIFHAGSGTDLTPPASRHLFDRRSGTIDTRSQERQSSRPDQRQAGF